MDTTKPEDDGKSRNTEPDGISLFSDRDWITVDEAVIYFRSLGLPRSPEAIRGYCRHGKLEATTTQGVKGEQHVIKRESARVYIEDRKKVLEAMSRDMPEDTGKLRKLPVHSVTYRQIPEDAETAYEGDEEALRAKDDEIASLKDEIMGLKIDKAARDQVVGMLRDERAQFATDVREASRTVGELEATLRAAAPQAWEQLVSSRSEIRTLSAKGIDVEHAPSTKLENDL